MTQKKKAIILDTDDAILDYCKGIVNYAKDRYNYTVLTPEPMSYDLENTFGINSVMVDHLLSNFNNGSYEFGLLKPIDEDVVCSIKYLRNAYPDVEFIVVTKCGNSPLTKNLRMVNLINVFGSTTFDDVIFLQPGESKLKTFKRLKKQFDLRIVVDDFVGNIDDAQSLNINSIVYERPHNIKLKSDKYNFHQNWTTIYDEICEALDKE